MQRHCNYIPLCSILIIKAAIQKDLIEYYRLMNSRYDRHRVLMCSFDFLHFVTW